MLLRLVFKYAENVMIEVDAVFSCCSTVNVAPVSGFFRTQLKALVDESCPKVSLKSAKLLEGRLTL
jgi:hypothetical protein